MIDLSVNLRAIGQYIAILGLVVAAFRWGQAPEKLSAMAFAMLPVFEIIYHLVFGVGLSVFQVDLGHFVISVAGASAFTWIALYANREYPLWLSALQLVALSGHLTRNYLPSVDGLAYQLLVVGPSYAMIIVLALGIWSHHRRWSRSGPYRPWRKSIPRYLDKILKN